MTLRLEFHGAARTITGSCYVLDNGASRVMFDCGMFQGSKTESELNYRPFPFVAENIDALVLSPRPHRPHRPGAEARQAGFAGAIHATKRPATVRDHAAGFRLHPGNRGREAQRAQSPPRACRKSSRSTPCTTPSGRYQAFQPITAMRVVRAGRRIAGPVLERRPSPGLGVDRGGGAAAGCGKPTRLLFSGDIGPATSCSSPTPKRRPASTT